MAKVSKRGGFSDRNKIKPENTEIQLKEFDKRTRVQLQNMISQFYKEIYGDEYYDGENIQEFLRYVIGTIYSEPVDTSRTYYENEVFKIINNTIQEDDYDDDYDYSDDELAENERLADTEQADVQTEALDTEADENEAAGTENDAADSGDEQ